MSTLDNIWSYLSNRIIKFAIASAEIFGVLFAAVAVLKEAGAIDAQPLINDLWSTMPGNPMPPADLADMVERNIVGQDWAAGEAAKSGMSGNLFDLLVKDTGEPPGIMEMLSLYRRGLLDEATLDTMVAYSRIRTEWTPQVKLLRYETMSAADALMAVVKGVIDDATGEDYFGKAGGMPDQWQTMLDTSGDAIGVEQVLNLWLHGFATAEDVKAVILHSRINPKFEPLAAELWRHYLPAFQIERVVKAGGATPQQAGEWLTQLGYPADQVAAMVHASTGAAVAKHKDITETQIVDLYEAQFISEAEAETLLGALGYPAEAVAYILEVNAAKKALAQLNKAMLAVQKAYIAGRLSDSGALADLARLEVPPAAAQQYLADWKIDRALEFKTLTMAQVGALLKKGGLTQSEAVTRWSAMGYDAIDAGLLLFDYGGPAPSGSPAASKGA